MMLPHREEHEEGDEEEEEEEDDDDGEEEEEEDDDVDGGDDSDLEYAEPYYVFIGFDPTFSSCFVVLVLLTGRLDDVAIYSSETRKWIQRGWRYGTDLVATADCVFLNGFMHLVSEEETIVTVDTNGEVGDTIPIPRGMDPSNGRTSTSMIGQSQGLLHIWYIDHEEYLLSVWALEDNSWTRKLNVDVMDLFDTIGMCYFEVIAIYPERNLIFITDGEMSTISYDMDKREAHDVCTCGEFLGGLPYFPSLAKL